MTPNTITVAGDRPWVWQQDCAPYHVSNKSLAWLEEHCYDLIKKTHWPPNSPDLNPLDYFFWGYLKVRVNRAPQTTKASLMASIMEESSILDKDTMARACSRFRGRVEKVVEAEGGWIE